MAAHANDLIEMIRERNSSYNDEFYDHMAEEFIEKAKVVILHEFSNENWVLHHCSCAIFRLEEWNLLSNEFTVSLAHDWLIPKGETISDDYSEDFINFYEFLEKAEEYPWPIKCEGWSIETKSEMEAWIKPFVDALTRHGFEVYVDTFCGYFLSCVINF